MNRHGRIGVRIALTVVFGLFCVPQLIFGGYLLVCWFRIHTANVYYVDYPYLLAGLTFVGVGACLGSPRCHLLLRHRRPARILGNTMTALRDDISRTASLKMTLDIPEKVWVVGAAGKDYPVHKQ